MYMVSNSWLGDRYEHGWGNGYVAVPEGHPWFGTDYTDIGYWPDMDELTYSCMVGDNWVVGFDTNHLGQNPKDQDMEYVLASTRKLMQYAIEACN